MSKLKTVNGNELLDMDIDPPEFIVSEIMPVGLHILAGSPKIGKSWLVLWLCDQIAKGERIWEYDTQRSGVLYLALEDTYNRLHHRLTSITEMSSENINLAIESYSLEQGLLSQLREYMFENNNIKLIVIDTFQQIRNAYDRVNYANDYYELTTLKKLADEYNIAILLVHHLRKMADSDPVNMISGSSGVSGAVDNIYILSKEKRIDNKAILTITGRDVPDKALNVEFDRECNIWRFISYVTEEINDTKQLFNTIKQLLKENGDYEGSASELVDQLGSIDCPKNRITSILNMNVITLRNSFGIEYSYKRTNSKRIISLKNIINSDTEIVE